MGGALLLTAAALAVTVICGHATARSVAAARRGDYGVVPGR